MTSNKSILAPMSKKNAFVSLFASVQLALFLLFILAATSIIGTVIPQNNVFDFYVQRYGEKTAQFFHLLDIPDMYGSWWFLGLLGLFSLNLIVCSLERIPQVIRIYRRDNLEMNVEQLGKMGLKQEIVLKAGFDAVVQQVEALFKGQGWQVRWIDKPGGRLFAADHGCWSRFGVYVVHCSILVILAGALLGSPSVADKLLGKPTFAFKGSIMLPEGEVTDHITPFKQRTHIDLDFSIRCDDFTIEYYPNGMPKSYRSLVSILEQSRVVRQEKIEVNQPLTHKGVTFYQSSYQPFQQYRVQLRRQQDGLENRTIIAPAEESKWLEAGVTYGIINRESQGEVTRRLKIWFSDGQGDPVTQWIIPGQETTIQRPGASYTLLLDQVYATGLQATKDPGVGLVYSGCLLMLVGLYVAFFLSHRRLFAVVTPQQRHCRIVFAGESNKNRVGFEKKFSEFINKLDHNS